MPGEMEGLRGGGLGFQKRCFSFGSLRVFSTCVWSLETSLCGRWLDRNSFVEKLGGEPRFFAADPNARPRMQ